MGESLELFFHWVLLKVLREVGYVIMHCMLVKFSKNKSMFSSNNSLGSRLFFLSSVPPFTFSAISDIVSMPQGIDLDVFLQTSKHQEPA